MKLSAHELTGVPETTLFTLYMRFRESRTPGGLIHDSRYGDTVSMIDYDFGEMERIPDEWQHSIAIRTRIFDSIVRKRIETSPDTVVVNLGAGLDFRFDRVDNGRIRWFDIDVPEVIELRRRLFGETDRQRPIPASVLDFSWMERIPAVEDVLFTAEGLFIYFTGEEVRRILTGISDRFRDSFMVLDVMGSFYLDLFTVMARDSLRYRNPFLQRMFGLWRWALNDWHEIEAWHPGIRFVDEWLPSNEEKNDTELKEMGNLLRESGQVNGVDRIIEAIRSQSRIGLIELGAQCAKKAPREDVEIDYGTLG